jgi:hypothetical protein
MSQLPPPMMAYATPQHDRKPAPGALFWTGFAFWLVAAGVGLLMFLGFLVTEWGGFAIGGFFWLYVGGLLTFVSFVLGAVYLGLAISSKFTGGTGRRAVLAVLLPILNIPLAVLLVWGGAVIVDRAVNAIELSLANLSTSRVDRVVALVPDGSQLELGAVDPNDSRVVYVNAKGYSTVTLDVFRADGKTWHQKITHYGGKGGPDLSFSKKKAFANLDPAEATTRPAPRTPGMESQ